MLNCRDVSVLVSESLDRKLTIWQKMNLWMHLSMCKLCSRFRKDIVHLDSEARRLAQESERDQLDQDITLPAEARERLVRNLCSQR